MQLLKIQLESVPSSVITRPMMPMRITFCFGAQSRIRMGEVLGLEGPIEYRAAQGVLCCETNPENKSGTCDGIGPVIFADQKRYNPVGSSGIRCLLYDI